MRTKINRNRYNIVEMIRYSKQVGKAVNELTEEEIKRFEIGKHKFGGATAYPIEEGQCYICKKNTVWIDRIHIVHICSQECMHVIDKKYENGEKINRNEKMYAHLQEAGENLRDS